MSGQSVPSGPGVELDRAPSRNAWRAIAALAVVLAMAIAAFLVSELREARERAILAAEQQGRMLTRLLEGQTTDAVGAVELALRRLADSLARLRSGEETAAAGAVEDLLRRETGAIGTIRAILLIDQAGRTVGSSDPKLAAGVDPAALADIETSPRAADLRIAAPVSVGSDVLVPIKLDARGAASETLVALLHPDHFAQLFRAVELGMEDSVALYATSGHVVACHPACPDGLGQVRRDAPPLADGLPRVDEGVIREADPAGGLSRLVSYRQVAGHPLVLALSLDGDGIVAGWRREVRNALLVGVTLLIVVTFLSVLLRQQLRRREAIRVELQESEARFRIVADTMPVPFWICDSDGALTLLNRAWLAFTGRTMEEQRGGGWEAVIHPEDLPGLTAAYRQALREHAPYSRDYRLHGADGQYRWFHDAALPRFGSDGTFLGLTGTLQDITERRQAETALADSERRFRNLLQNMRNIIFCSGAKGSGEHGYEGRPRIYGADAQRMAGTVEGGLANVALWYDSIHPEDRPAYFEAERRRKELGETYTIEYRFRHPITGEPKWARETGWAGKDAESGDTYFDSFILEITEEKRAAEELRESEDRFRSIVAALGEGVVFQDADGQILSCNARAEQILGLTLDQMRGRTSPDPRWRAVHEDGSAFAGDEHPAMVTLRTGRPCSNVLMGVHKPDGTLRWLSINSEPIFRQGSERPAAVVASFSDVTERRAAEQALRENQALLRAVLDAVPAAVNVRDRDGRYVLVNQYHASFHGRPPEWFLGKTVGEALPADYAGSVVERDRQFLDSDGASAMVESDYADARGRISTWLGTRAPVRDADGRIRYIVSVGLDITERKRAERAVRESRTLLRAVIDAVPASINVKTVDGRYVLVNAFHKTFHDRPPDWFIGKTPVEAFESDYGRQVVERDRRLVESGEAAMVFEEAYEETSSHVGVWLTTKAPVRGTAGQITHVVTVGFDITERKRAEEALRESEQRFRSMADSVPALVWMSDQTGQRIFVNRRWLEYTGRDMEHELGRGYVENIHPEDQDEVLEFERRSFDQHSLFMKDYRLRGGDGEYRWFLDTAAARFTPDGTYLGHIGLLVDINDRRRLELEVEQARRIEVIGQLTGGVAHDFNNLLTVILGNTEMLLGALDPDTRPYTLARLVRLAALRGDEITQRLLAFGRRQALQPTELDLNRLVRGQKDLLRRTLGDEILVETELAERVWLAHADPLQVENALLNLALNARDAMPKGGVLTIRTGNRTVEPDSALARDGMRLGDYISFSVTDSGAGMSREVAERAFEPFFTTKGIGKGTGLGLSTVYGFARQSGGHAAIDSIPGKGTTVSVFLPRTSEELRDVAEAELADTDAPGGQQPG